MEELRQKLEKEDSWIQACRSVSDKNIDLVKAESTVKRKIETDKYLEEIREMQYCRLLDQASARVHNMGNEMTGPGKFAPMEFRLRTESWDLHKSVFREVGWVSIH